MKNKCCLKEWFQLNKFHIILSFPIHFTNEDVTRQQLTNLLDVPLTYKVTRILNLDFSKLRVKCFCFIPMIFFSILPWFFILLFTTENLLRCGKHVKLGFHGDFFMQSNLKIPSHLSLSFSASLRHSWALITDWRSLLCSRVPQ